jgi:hypothetical protein
MTEPDRPQRAPMPWWLPVVIGSGFVVAGVAKLIEGDTADPSYPENYRHSGFFLVGVPIFLIVVGSIVVALTILAHVYRRRS